MSIAKKTQGTCVPVDGNLPDTVRVTTIANCAGVGMGCSGGYQMRHDWG